MSVHQVDFFKGTSQIFARNIMKIAKANTFDAGAFIFQVGDPARHFYILLEGCVHLSVGRSEDVFSIISRSGDGFGWSSLAGSKYYSAWAKSLIRTRLIAFERYELLEVVKKDPSNGITMYKSLAMTLAYCLLQSYLVIAEVSSSAACPGQVCRRLQGLEETA